MKLRSDTNADEAAPPRSGLWQMFGRKPPVPVAPPPVPEKFELLKSLGKGAFAETWLARVLDPDLCDQFDTDIVALKVPFRDWTDAQIFKEIVIMEKVAQRVRAGEAKNIVPFLGAGVHQNRVVIAMQYMPDGSLRHRLGPRNRQRRLPPDQAVAVTAGILNGLDFLHRDGIFHRDIKPANILFAGEEPHLCDLGVARILASNQLASTYAGALGYMAPEVPVGQGTFTADLWSVGVVLYEMLTGDTPQSRKGGESAWATDLLPPAELCADLSPGLNALVMRALRFNPAERFASAAEMRRALLDLADPGAEQFGAASGAIDVGETTLTVEADPRKLCSLGQEYMLKQNYSAAILAFEHGLRLKKDDAALHWELALVLRDLGRLPEARYHWQRVLELGDAALHRSAEELLMLWE